MQPNGKKLRERSDLRIEALGSGSDFTPFLQHLGIASLNIGYGGEGEGGSYHSIYDSFDYYTRFWTPVSPTASPWRKPAGPSSASIGRQPVAAARVLKFRRHGF